MSRICPIKRWLFCTSALILLAIGSLWSAKTKMHDYSSLGSLKVGMSVSQLQFLGSPASASHRERIYTLPDQSNLVIAVEDGAVASAWLELRSPLKIEDPSLRDMQFVQMGMDESQSPNWFYAASPGEGRIFKVSDRGYIQTITWVRPFSQNGGRQLQALLNDFTNQRPFHL